MQPTIEEKPLLSINSEIDDDEFTKPKKKKIDPYVMGKVMTTDPDQDISHDYADQDIGCMTELFKTCLSCKGWIFTLCCIPCACCGGGPTIKVPEGQRAALLIYGKLVRIVPPGTYHVNVGIEEYRLCPISVLTLEIPSQRVMTRDNVSVGLDAVCFYQILDVQSALFNVRDYEKATRNLAQITLEQLIAQHSLDELISVRSEITKKTTKLLDKHTSHWGIHVSGLEIRDINIPDSMQRVMAIAAEAKREGEAAVIMAQAEYKAAETYVKAANVMSANPIALQLRYFQTLKEIAAEQNSTILVPSEITNMFKGLSRGWDGPMSYPSPQNTMNMYPDFQLPMDNAYNAPPQPRKNRPQSMSYPNSYNISNPQNEAPEFPYDQTEVANSTTQHVSKVKN